MILGMTVYTFIHVLLSLIGIASGLIVLYGFLTANPLKDWTFVFVLTTVATVLTGFGFPVKGFTPAIGVGILSTLLLIAVILGRYVFHMAGPWRAVFVITSVIALYFNVFVFIAQAFQKIPALHALAPTGSEPPFAVVQGLTLIGFVIAGFFSAKRFHPLTVQA